jgi:GNAT superfamily N-acetyltransferase
MDELQVEIKPAKKEELDLLQSEFSPTNLSMNHHKRFEIQENGKGVYLIAWHNNKPIGHFLLRFDGPEKDTSNDYPYPTPYLEAGGTRSPYRRQGVATRMIEKAEDIASQKGFDKIGLAVGSTDNPDAKRLYEKLDYADWGKGEFEVSWDYKSIDGKTGTESEICIYMFKNL